MRQYIYQDRSKSEYYFKIFEKIKKNLNINLYNQPHFLSYK